MSAELLREAAALMRERAEAAEGCRPSPWSDGDGACIRCADGTRIGNWIIGAEERAHIASWHPSVALAVADWLDSEAGVVDDIMGGTHTTAAYVGPAFEVARAYLGRDA